MTSANPIPTANVTANRRFRPLLGVLFSVLLAIGVVGALTAGAAQANSGSAVASPAQSTAAAALPVYYQIRAQHSGKCLDLKDTRETPRTNNGTNVRQWACKSGYSLQQWRFAKLANGYYQVVNRYSGKCLDVESGLPYNGTNVHQWTCSASAANQQWWLRNLGTGYYELRPRINTSKCLDVEDVSTANGADVYIWSCVGGHNQHWQLARVA